MEILDLGQTRISRTLLAIPVPDEDDEDVLEAFLVKKGLSLDVYLAQKGRAEVNPKQMTAREWEQKEKGHGQRVATTAQDQVDMLAKQHRDCVPS